ncbi:MAG: hypothetical protein J5595_08645 [Bacteroidales bacterium]|nr:hypothetical protein [Bacteroidales bacterium]
MKKTLSIITALILASCGGGTTTNTQNQPSAVSDTTTTQPAPSKTTEGGLSTADLTKIVGMLSLYVDNPGDLHFKFDGNGGSCVYEDKNSLRCETKFRCFPMKGGGWMIYAPTEYIIDKGHYFSSLAFLGYKDGEEISVDPDLGLLSEIDSKHPTNEVYTFNDNGLIVRTLQNGKIIATEYNWNGEIMVACDDSGESTTTDNKDIVMQFWGEFLKTYYPLGVLKVDDIPDDESVASTLGIIAKTSPTIAMLANYDENGFEETVSCYKHKNGSYMVVCNYVPKSNEAPRIMLYTFKNGKITPFDDGTMILPEYVENKTDGNCHYLAKGYYVQEIGPNGFSVGGKDGDDYNLTWNGESFVNNDLTDGL